MIRETQKHFRWNWTVWFFTATFVLFTNASVSALPANSISGTVFDPQHRIVQNALVRVSRPVDGFEVDTVTDEKGSFAFAGLDIGEYRVTVEAAGFKRITRDLIVGSTQNATIQLQFAEIASQAESVTVTADVGDSGVYSPDPATRVLIRQETLDANPGRPGMPISIPGMPVESPAGGIKPPQYFVPGVAGDHGEPIGQFFQIGSYLFPNNLPANAHGNGYADPNILIPIAIESVQTDGGAFNIREGNNSVNAAMIFSLRDRLAPVTRLAGDYRDIDFVTGWSPSDTNKKEWAGIEVSYGNGFLQRLEHRQQYKVNAARVLNPGNHELTVYGIGYYGFSYLPGLAPIDVHVPNDTIDSRQSEQASSAILIANDIWRVSAHSQVQFSGFFRTYKLDVRPNFGDGLIRQSEFRTANSENTMYSIRLRPAFSFLAGLEHRRDAPRKVNLDRYSEEDRVFTPVTSNDLTINSVTPFASADGSLGRWVHYNLGMRRDEVFFGNRDRLVPTHSFTTHEGVDSPKGTLSLVLPEALPSLALSYGQAFHINDPRIGTTEVRGGTVISKARSYQLVARKTISGTDIKLTLGHVTVAQQLAKISNDTGLQEDVGPALIRSMTISARRYFSGGSIQASFSKADARDRITGEPTPEAPRLIWDVLGTLDRLPLHLQARGEYEYVGRKPLGDGFNAVPVKEFRGAVIRPFESRHMDIGVNFFVARGFAGQTLETLALAGEGEPYERITGFRLRVYVTASWTYQFSQRAVH